MEENQEENSSDQKTIYISEADMDEANERNILQDSINEKRVYATEWKNGKSIIYVTAEENEQTKSEWTREATKEVLKLFDEKMDMVENGIIGTQKKMWEMINRDMTEAGFYYTPAQCENKWKSLKRAYRSKMEKSQKNKSYKRMCPFEKEVSEILAKRNNVSMFETVVSSDGLFTVEVAEQDSSAGADFFNINLNEPPGPSNTSDNSDEEVDSKRKLHNLIRNREDPLSGSQSKRPVEKSSLRDELLELKKEIKSQNMNILMLQHKAVETNARIARHLESLEEKENKKLEQMKIQNALLQKLVERL